MPILVDLDEPVIVGYNHQPSPKIYLKDHGLARWHAPGDGSCFLWSADVADGSIPPGAFDFGSGTQSPLDYEDNHERARELAARMRAQRLQIVNWELDPDNFVTLMNEHDLLEPDHSAVSVDAAHQYLEDRAWSKDGHIKARQVLAGSDLVSVVVRRDKSGSEYFLDKVSIFRSAGTQVQEITSFLDEILPRLEAQRMGPVKTRVSLVDFSGSCHFNAVVSDSVLPPPNGHGAESPAGVTHAWTIKGGQLTRVILDRIKRIENRHFKISPGWYALHTGQTLGSDESQLVLAAN